METIIYKRKKTRGQKQEKLDNLPVEVIDYRLPEEEQVCPCCGGLLHEMTTEVREKLKVIPAEVKVVRHASCLACWHCEHQARGTHYDRTGSEAGLSEKLGFTFGNGLHDVSEIPERAATLPLGTAVSAAGRRALPANPG